MAQTATTASASQTNPLVPQESQQPASGAQNGGGKIPESQAILNPPDFHEDIHYRIERRAYELWERRGRVENDALRDWLQAEVELRPALGIPEQNQLTET